MKSAEVALIAAVFLVLNLVAGAARAAPNVEVGWYAGADLGRMEYDFDEGFVDFSDNAFGVHGGYRFARYFAIEAGYADLGSYDFTVECPDTCVPELYPVYIEVSSQRLELDVLGILPLGERLEAYAKAGIARTEFDVFTREGLSGSSRYSTRSSDPIYGIGLRLHFDAPWSLRLQWERVPDINDSGADLNVVWLGAEYRFGG